MHISNFFKAAAAAVLICLALVTVPLSARGQQVLIDTTGPTISGWKIREQAMTMKAGDTLHVSVRITDVSGVSPRDEDCVLQLYHVDDRKQRIVIGLAYNARTGLYDGTRVIPQGLANGVYDLSVIMARDIFGNTSSVSKFTTPELKQHYIVITGGANPTTLGQGLTAFQAAPATMLLNPGTSAYLSLYINPASAVDEVQSIRVVSNSNPAVASYDGNVVTGKTPGTTAIVIQGSYHGLLYTTQCVVTVTDQQILPGTVPGPVLLPSYYQ